MRFLGRVSLLTAIFILGSLAVTVLVIYAQGGTLRVTTDCQAMTPAPPAGSLCIQLTTGRPKFYWYSGTAWAQMGMEDTIGSAATLGGIGQRATVALAGQNGAVLSIPANVTLVGALTPVVSTDGTTWRTTDHLENQMATFVTANGQPLASLAFPIDEPTRPIVLAVHSLLPTTHIGVEVTSYTSGNASTTLRAMAVQPLRAAGGAGATGLWPFTMTDLGDGKPIAEFGIKHPLAAYAQLRDESATLAAVNSVVSIAGGAGQVCFEVQSGLTGTTTHEANIGAGSYFTVPVVFSAGGVSTFPQRGCFTATGYSVYRVRVTAASAGSATATLVVAPNSGPSSVSSVSISDGTNTALIDPCASITKTTTAISQTTTTRYVTASSGKKTYVCSIMLVANAAETVSLVEGTGTTCTTPTALIGSATAANGVSLAANGGFQLAAGNQAAVVGIGTNVDVCVLQAGSNRVTGFITTVQR